MLKPSVGLTVVMSSPFSRFTMVVFPALSRPLWHAMQRVHQGWDCAGPQRPRQLAVAACARAGHGLARNGAHSLPPDTYTMRMRISFSLRLTFLMMLSRPISAALQWAASNGRQSLRPPPAGARLQAAASRPGQSLMAAARLWRPQQQAHRRRGSGASLLVCACRPCWCLHTLQAARNGCRVPQRSHVELAWVRPRREAANARPSKAAWALVLTPASLPRTTKPAAKPATTPAPCSLHGQARAGAVLVQTSLPLCARHARSGVGLCLGLRTAGGESVVGIMCVVQA